MKDLRVDSNVDIFKKVLDDLNLNEGDLPLLYDIWEVGYNVGYEKGYKVCEDRWLKDIKFREETEDE